jgi:hypothetical protein
MSGTVDVGRRATQHLRSRRTFDQAATGLNFGSVITSVMV